MINQSEQIDELTKALVAARKNIKAATKGEVNYFKKKYADINAYINACADALLAEGLIITQHPVTEYIAGDSQTPAVALTGCTSVIMHSGGQWQSSTLLLPCEAANAQKGGSCITYARRYQLQAILMLEADDDDAQTAMPTKKKEIAKGFGYVEIVALIDGATSEQALTELYKNHIAVNAGLTQIHKDTLTASCKKRKEQLTKEK